MPTRPTWSGTIQISLVSIAVKIFPATNPGKQVEFHQNVDEGGEVAKADIVKGFEYAKDKYIEIEPDELKSLRLPTATTMPIKQFVKAGELSPGLFDRPYFVVPKDEVQAKALSIMRKALVQTDTLGVGEIAFSGREHLVAIGAPIDPKQKGLMLYLLRYDDELRDPKPVFSDVKEISVDADELSLAKQLIKGKTGTFDLTAYKNDYEAAVKKLVDVKRKGKTLPEPEPEAVKTKVVNIMDALRSSLQEEKMPGKTAKAKKTTGRGKAA
jgi:DNA end-binding protein Ku